MEESMEQNIKPLDEARLRAATDVLHWSWSLLLQIQRFMESEAEAWSATPASAAEYAKRMSAEEYDEHMIFIAGNNLITAAKRAREHFPEIEEGAEVERAIHLLRNVYEHWEETRSTFFDPTVPKKRSSKNLREEFPAARPWFPPIHAPGMYLLGGVVSMYDLIELAKNFVDYGMRLTQLDKVEGGFVRRGYPSGG
jgi:hypothetical protein